MAEASIVELSSKAIEKLKLTPEVHAALLAVQAELTAAYQQRFVEMIQAIRQQASALERLQSTLNILVEHVAPTLKGTLPPALRVAGPDEDAEVARVMLTADPIAAGYTLTQTHLAHALNIPQSDVSILVKPFKLTEDDECAVVVRRGKNRDTINYHPRAIERFQELVATPPLDLTPNEKQALKRVIRRIGPTPIGK